MMQETTSEIIRHFHSYLPVCLFVGVYYLPS